MLNNNLVIKKTGLILLEIKKQNVAQPKKIAKELNYSYIHTYNLLQELKKQRIINIEYDKKNLCFISLTDYGMNMAEYIEKIIYNYSK